MGAIPRVGNVSSSLIRTRADRTRLAAGTVFRDCEICPAMVLVQAGSFTAGSPSNEIGREESEGPQHTVNINYSLAVSRYEVTRGEFAEFVAETGYSPSGCYAYDGAWRLSERLRWREPGYARNDSHPVTCVSWHDAKVCADWLRARSAEEYRLLSSSEWEYVARAGSGKGQCQGIGSRIQRTRGLCPGSLRPDCCAWSGYHGLVFRGLIKNTC